MSTEKTIGIGLIGLGVVGSGVAQVLHEKEQSIATQLGRPLALRRVALRDLSKPRPFTPPGVALTTQAKELLDDPEIDIIIEVMGGERPAFEYIQQAVAGGKHVVTANKAVMAMHGPEVLALAERHGTSVRFEATVGGGIPIIGPLLKDLLANEITAVHAIINGTTNYILTRMAQEGLDFEPALQNAQELGYAEGNPADDVEGRDAAYKLAILAMLAFHTQVHASDVFCEGIGRITAQDFRYAGELGYAIKLLAIGRRTDRQVQVRVHPAFVPMSHPLGKVEGVFNAVELEGDLVGWTMFHGRGAGRLPTSSAVISDVLEIAGSIVSGGRPSAPRLDHPSTIQPMAEVETQYYLRLQAADRPGVMAQIAHVLGEMEVSLASVIQKETLHPDGLAEIVITTHVAREEAVQEALRRLARLEVVKEVCNLVRVEELPP